jgi:F0F1-type ATP synthase assembly protein I
MTFKFICSLISLPIGYLLIALLGMDLLKKRKENNPLQKVFSFIALSTVTVIWSLVTFAMALDAIDSSPFVSSAVEWMGGLF